MRLLRTASVAGLCSALAAGCGGAHAPANAVSVPKVVGLDLVTATQAVKRSRLCWEIEFGTGGGTAIVRQKPRAGSRVGPRTAVKLYLGLDFTTSPPDGLAQAAGCPPYLFTLAGPKP